MSSVLFFENFIDNKTCSELNKWVYEGVEKKWLDRGAKNGGSGLTYDKRLTTRPYGDRFEYPEVVFEVFDQITKFLNIGHLSKSVTGGGKNGVVVSYTYPGGDVYVHKDRMEPKGHVLRCNVMTQMADGGGELFVDDEKVDIKVGDLHCYLASKSKHYVTKVKGNTPRILWMFGYQCSLEEFEKIRDKYHG